jgi:O-methyltransferase
MPVQGRDITSIIGLTVRPHRFTGKRLSKRLAFRVPLVRNHLIAWYPYEHTPAQLAFLCRCLDETRDVPGLIVEAGCFTGWTTVFLNRHMSVAGIEKPYVALDTFSGARAADLDVEVTRGKDRERYDAFAVNDRRWFDLAVRRAGVSRVTSIAADIGAFDFSLLAPIAFCLLDVVFYQPTRLALPRIWAALGPGGILVVDDYFEKGSFDGAGQACREFAEAQGLAAERVLVKYAVLRKDAK